VNSTLVTPFAQVVHPARKQRVDELEAAGETLDMRALDQVADGGLGARLGCRSRWSVRGR
jgi:hypothetical protein